MKNKIKFALNGITFEIPSTCLKTTDYWGAPLETPTISIGRKEIPLIGKQFIKAKYPNLLVWGSSSVFANGNSADIYVCNADGSEMDWDSIEFRNIKSFIENLRGGRYNGMEDIYEYAEWGTTDTGTALDFGAKYITVNPKAPFGTWPDVKRMLLDMVAGKYVWGALSLEEAIQKVKGYSIKDAVIQKAIAEMA